MSEMVKVLYDDYLEQKRPVQGESSNHVKSEEGEDLPKYLPSPPSSPYSFSSSSSSTSNTTSSRKNSHKHKPDMPLLKLDVKKYCLCMMVKLMLRKLIIMLDRWRYIVICSKLNMRKPKSYWHLFSLKEQLSSTGKVKCNIELNKLVIFFHHGMILFPHLENSSILWGIRKRL
jgi:hypothetical protein